MSADNGYVIRERLDGKFELLMYFMSDENDPPEPAKKPEDDDIFDTLEAAVRAYNDKALEPGFICEYGLSISLRPKESNADLRD